MASDDDYLDRLLQDSNPLRGANLATPELSRALDDVTAKIVAQPPGRVRARRSWQRLRPRSLTLVAAAVAFASTGAAVASQFLGAHTGRYPTSRADVRAGGSGEELNLAAPDGRQVALQVASGLSYPQGFLSWRDWQITVAVHAGTPQPCPPGVRGTCPSLVSTSALRGAFAMSAFCAWTVAWRQSEVRGDRTAAAQAAQVIKGAPRWNAVTTLQAASGSGAGSNPFGSMSRYVAAVSSGNLTQLDALLAGDTSGKACWTFDPAFVKSASTASDPGAAYIQFLDRNRS